MRVGLAERFVQLDGSYRAALSEPGSYGDAGLAPSSIPVQHQRDYVAAVRAA